MAVFEQYTILRDIALTFLAVTIAFTIEFAIYFLIEWYRNPNRKISDLRFAWSLFLISWAFNIMFFIMSDFYASGVEREFWIKLGYIALLSGLSVFSNIQEHALPWNTHNFFGFFGVSGVIASIILPHSILKYVAPFFYTPVFLVLFIIFSIVIIRRSSGPLRIYALFLIVGFTIFLIGYGMTIDLAVEAFGVISYTIGTVFLASGVIIMSFGIMNIPSLGEWDWPTKILEVILLHKNGQILIDVKNTKKFTQKESTEDTSSMDALTGIDALLKEITTKKGTIKTIDHGDVKLIFGTSKMVSLVVIAEEDLKIIPYKITEFLNVFLSVYEELLNTGEIISDVAIFKPAENVLRKVFELE